MADAKVTEVDREVAEGLARCVLSASDSGWIQRYAPSVIARYMAPERQRAARTGAFWERQANEALAEATTLRQQVETEREFIEAWDAWRSLTLVLAEARSEGRLVEAATLQGEVDAALDAAFFARARIHLGKTEDDG